jgi:hypothetical protein
VSSDVRSRSTRCLLATCALALALGCSNGDPGEAKPGTFRVLKAIVTSFLSNSVDAQEAGQERGEDKGDRGLDAQRPAPGPPPTFASMEPEPPKTCVVPYNGPVTIVPVRTSAVLARSVAERRDARLVYETDDTAIWEDGRVLTMNVEDLGTHLNAVGWASNPMQILGASTRPGSSSSNLGWGSGQTSFKNPVVKKRRRRRG